MRTELFKFNIPDFEEVYVIVDNNQHRLHISPVYYRFNITLDLSRDLNEQIMQQTKFGEMNFNRNVQDVAKTVINKLGLQ